MPSVFLEDISSKKGLAPVMVFEWEFKDEAYDLKKKKKKKKQHNGFSRGKFKPYFKSPDNKINRQLPSWRRCLQLTKATVSTVGLARPPCSLIVLTVRFSVHIYSLTFFVLNFHMVITSCSPQKSPLSGYASTKALDWQLFFHGVPVHYVQRCLSNHSNKNNRKQPPPTRWLKLATREGVKNLKETEWQNTNEGLFPFISHVDVSQKPSQYCNHPPIKINNL